MTTPPEQPNAAPDPLEPCYLDILHAGSDAPCKADPQEATPREVFFIGRAGYSGPQPAVWMDDWRRLKSEAAALRQRVQELEAENFTLAAGQCLCVVGDEGGNAYCTMQAKLAAEAKARRVAEQQISEIKAALTGDDYASLPSDIPVVRMAHTIRFDHDKFRNQVRDTCRRAEQAEALAERLKQEAQIHAQEARTANATIAEIYQACSGATGAPGNWNGAKPVIDALAKAEARAREDARRLDFLESEDKREGAFKNYNSLFRRNLPITRAAIDAAIDASEGGQG